ncbi:MAG TPA: DinB family protein, partial [Gemmatimonadales bacterium]|nr:DinB family protein [Gemmatimonadales bacterium]
MAARAPAALTRWRRQAVRRMATSREATLALVARLPERELLRPRTIDRWSIKDVLVHLLSCDEETLRRFRLIARGQGRRIHWFESMADADRFNA